MMTPSHMLQVPREERRVRGDERWVRGNCGPTCSRLLQVPGDERRVRGNRGPMCSHCLQVPGDEWRVRGVAATNRGPMCSGLCVWKVHGSKCACQPPRHLGVLMKTILLEFSTAIRPNLDRTRMLMRWFIFNVLVYFDGNINLDCNRFLLSYDLF